MTLTAQDRDVLAGWRAEVERAFDHAIGSARRVAFLMYPYDGNVGNHMMFLALVEHLRRRGVKIAYAAHKNNFRVAGLRRSIGTDPILFSGGVSLSRLWPAHPSTKRLVAREFPANRIVSLTSTMLWVDDDDRRDAAEVFEGHDDVVVMARDPQSAANARAVMPAAVDVVTAPDSAFGLQPVEPGGPPEVAVLWLRRDDPESKLDAAPDEVETFDWSNDLRRAQPRAYLLLRLSGVFSRLRTSRVGVRLCPLLNPIITRCYVRASYDIVAGGHRTLDRGRVLVTDRMHPHVLAALRGQHVVLLPDRFGKNRLVYDWMSSKVSCVHWADTPAEALTLARSLARQA